MKKFILLLLSFLIGIGLFICIGRMVGWQEIGKSFLTFTGWQGMVILLLTIFMALVGTWKWKEILKGEGVNVPFKNLLSPYLSGFAIMFLAPVLIWGGEVFRSYVLKERCQVPWSKGMASVVIDRILEWTANLVVIFFGSLFFIFMIGSPPSNLGLIFGGAFFIFAAGISFFYFKCLKSESIVRFFVRGDQKQPIDTEKEIFNFFQPRNMALWKGFSLSFLRAGFMYLRVWILIFFLGENIGTLPALSLLGFNYLASMIPIPTALGSHEAIQTFAFNSLGLAPSLATVFTMIIRAAEIIISLVGIVALFRLGVILIKNMLFRKTDKLIDDYEI
jgi:uncharacterized protein (TIRG00374 family)